MTTVYHNGSCRMTNTNTTSLIDFRRLAASKCFTLLTMVFNSAFQMPLIDNGNGFLISYTNNLTLDLSNTADVEVIRSSLSEEVFLKWEDCNDAATKCCDNVMLTENVNNFGGKMCNAVWDGWACHSSTHPHQFSQVKCPSYIEANNCNSILGYIHFDCDATGNWYTSEKTGREWANYTQCFNGFVPVKHRIVMVNIISQSIAAVLLSLGLIVFFSYKTLQVNRITLHKNFFISLLLNGLIQIIWEAFFIRPMLLNPIAQNTIETDIPCVLIETFLHYSRSTNFFWMFCESYYLHQLLVTVFNEQFGMKVYYFIGWGIPLMTTILYIIWNLIAQTKGCWNNNQNALYLFTTPNILIMVINVIFLINVTRLIYKRLQYNNGHQQYRRTVKAALILVPLFGAHFLMSPLIMCESSKGAEVINIFNKIVESSQGTAVALIFCFLNKEVLSLLRGSLIQLKNRIIKQSEINVPEAITLQCTHLNIAD